MGIFDRLFRRADPATPHRRHIEAAGGAGSTRRRNFGSFGHTATETTGAATLSRSRARFLAVNNAYISHAVGNLTAAIAATGIRPALTGDTATAFEQWTPRADHHRRTDFYGLLSTAVRALIVDGEVLIVMRIGDDGALALQVISAEFLDESKSGTLPNGNEIIAGIEFDSEGRAVAYWLLPQLPNQQFTSFAPSVRFDAADVAHIMHPLGPGQA